MNLSRDLEPVWLISTLDKNPTRQEIQKINVEQSAREIIRKKSGVLSLRVESQLLFGLASVASRKARLLLEDSTETNRGLIKLFSHSEIDLVNRPDSSTYTLSSQPSQILDMLPQDLDLGKTLAKINADTLVRSQGHELSSGLGESDLGIDVDQSVDLITRRGADNELDDSILAHSENDDAILNDLNLTDNLMLSDGDFGIDDFDGGSSPPAEVSTPLGEDETGQITIVGSEAELDQRPKRKTPKRTSTKKKLAPLDAQTTAPLPTRPDSKILTTPPKVVQEELPTEMDKYLDPDYLRVEIKRRRLMGSDEVDVGDNDNDEIMADEDFDIPELDQSTILGDDSVDNGDDMVEDSELMVLEDSNAVEAEAASAKAALESALEKGPIVFKEIGTSRLQQAAAFAELLTMAAHGTVKVRQSRAFSEIKVQAV